MGIKKGDRHLYVGRLNQWRLKKVSMFAVVRVV